MATRFDLSLRTAPSVGLRGPGRGGGDADDAPPAPLPSRAAQARTPGRTRADLVVPGIASPGADVDTWGSPRHLSAASGLAAALYRGGLDPAFLARAESGRGALPPAWRGQPTDTDTGVALRDAPAPRTQPRPARGVVDAPASARAVVDSPVAAAPAAAPTPADARRSAAAWDTYGRVVALLSEVGGNGGSAASVPASPAPPVPVAADGQRLLGGDSIRSTQTPYTGQGTAARPAGYAVPASPASFGPAAGAVAPRSAAREVRARIAALLSPSAPAAAGGEVSGAQQQREQAEALLAAAQQLAAVRVSANAAQRRPTRDAPTVADAAPTTFASSSAAPVSAAPAAPPMRSARSSAPAFTRVRTRGAWDAATPSEVTFRRGADALVVYLPPQQSASASEQPGATGSAAAASAGSDAPGAGEWAYVEVGGRRGWAPAALVAPPPPRSAGARRADASPVRGAAAADNNDGDGDDDRQSTVAELAATMERRLAGDRPASGRGGGRGGGRGIRGGGGSEGAVVPPPPSRAGTNGAGASAAGGDMSRGGASSSPARHMEAERSGGVSMAAAEVTAPAAAAAGGRRSPSPPRRAVAWGSLSGRSGLATHVGVGGQRPLLDLFSAAAGGVGRGSGGRSGGEPTGADAGGAAASAAPSPPPSGARRRPSVRLSGDDDSAVPAVASLASLDGAAPSPEPAASGTTPTTTSRGDACDSPPLPMADAAALVGSGGRRHWDGGRAGSPALIAPRPAPVAGGANAALHHPPGHPSPPWGDHRHRLWPRSAPRAAAPAAGVHPQLAADVELREYGVVDDTERGGGYGSASGGDESGSGAADGGGFGVASPRSAAGEALAARDVGPRQSPGHAAPLPPRPRSGRFGSRRQHTRRSLTSAEVEGAGDASPSARSQAAGRGDGATQEWGSAALPAPDAYYATRGRRYELTPGIAVAATGVASTPPPPAPDAAGDDDGGGALFATPVPGGTDAAADEDTFVGPVAADAAVVAAAARGASPSGRMLSAAAKRRLSHKLSALDAMSDAIASAWRGGIVDGDDDADSAVEAVLAAETALHVASSPSSAAAGTTGGAAAASAEGAPTHGTSPTPLPASALPRNLTASSLGRAWSGASWGAGGGEGSGGGTAESPASAHGGPRAAAGTPPPSGRPASAYAAGASPLHVGGAAGGGQWRLQRLFAGLTTAQRLQALAKKTATAAAAAARARRFGRAADATAADDGGGGDTAGVPSPRPPLSDGAAAADAAMKLAGDDAPDGSDTDADSDDGGDHDDGSDDFSDDDGGAGEAESNDGGGLPDTVEEEDEEDDDGDDGDDEGGGDEGGGLLAASPESADGGGTWDGGDVRGSATGAATSAPEEAAGHAAPDAAADATHSAAETAAATAAVMTRGADGGTTAGSPTIEAVPGDDSSDWSDQEDVQVIVDDVFGGDGGGGGSIVAAHRRRDAPSIRVDTTTSAVDVTADGVGTGAAGGATPPEADAAAGPEATAGAASAFDASVVSVPPALSAAIEAPAAPQRDAGGRRVKIVAMSGAELWALMRPRLAGAAAALHLMRSALRSRRATRAFAVGLCARAPQLRMHATRAARAFAIGVAAGAPRRREALAAAGAARAAAIAAAATRAAAAAAAAPKSKPQLSRAATGVAPAGGVAALRSPAAARTRSIHWDALMTENAVHGTIWEGGGGGAAAGGRGAAPTRAGAPAAAAAAAGADSPLDLEPLLPQLIEQFTPSMPAAAAVTDGAVAGGAASSSAASAPMVTLLDDKVAKNAAIALRSALGRTPLPAVRDALATLSTAAFGDTPAAAAERLSLLLSQVGLFAPDATAKVAAYRGDVARLGAPERFVREVVLAVPDARTRLAAMEFSLSLGALASECAARLRALTACCAEVRGSPRFATLLLDCLLPLGNHLNAAAARGFRISSLARLAQTKNASGGETFLSFCVKGLLANPKHAHVVARLADDFPTLTGRADGGGGGGSIGDRLSLIAVEADVAKLERGLRQLEALRPSAAAATAAGDGRLAASLAPMLATARAAAAEQRARLVAAAAEFNSLARWLGEDPAKTDPGAVFGAIAAFIATVRRDVSAAEERAARAAAAEARKAKADAARTGGGAGGGGSRARSPAGAGQRRPLAAGSPASGDAGAGGTTTRIVHPAALAAGKAALRRRRRPSDRGDGGGVIGGVVGGDASPHPPGIADDAAATAATPTAPASARDGDGDDDGASPVSPRRRSSPVSFAGLAIATALAARLEMRHAAGGLGRHASNTRIAHTPSQQRPAGSAGGGGGSSAGSAATSSRGSRRLAVSSASTAPGAGGVTTIAGDDGAAASDAASGVAAGDTAADAAAPLPASSASAPASDNADTDAPVGASAAVGVAGVDGVAVAAPAPPRDIASDVAAVVASAAAPPQLPQPQPRPVSVSSAAATGVGSAPSSAPSPATSAARLASLSLTVAAQPVAKPVSAAAVRAAPLPPKPLPLEAAPPSVPDGDAAPPRAPAAPAPPAVRPAPPAVSLKPGLQLLRRRG